MRIFTCILLFFTNSFCLAQKKQLQTTADGTSNHQVKSIVGSTGNRLEVLDWGGTGQAIIFLTGLGNTAHVYDDFASGFADSFHVYGISRRGYGRSEQTPTGYGIDTLAKDILAVIDALGLAKVILIGHSIAGDEVTTFASKYPTRVVKVIYLDAAYDHSNLAEFPTFPEAPQRKPKDSISIEDLNSDLKMDRGFRFPDDELRHQYVFSDRGFVVKEVTPYAIPEAIVQGVRMPNYSAVKCPALAIYGQRNTAQQWFPSYPYMDSTNQQKAVNEFMPGWKKYYVAEMNRFKNEKPDGLLKEIPGADHYTFLTHPIETEKFIRAFLR